MGAGNSVCGTSVLQVWSVERRFCYVQIIEKWIASFLSTETNFPRKLPTRQGRWQKQKNYHIDNNFEATKVSCSFLDPSTSRQIQQVTTWDIKQGWRHKKGDNKKHPQANTLLRSSNISMVRFKQSGPRRQQVGSSSGVVGRSRQSGTVSSSSRTPKEAPVRKRKRRMRPGG